MKTLPDPTNDWSVFSDIITGGVRRKIFVSALRLKIFDHINGSTSEEIAANLEAHPRNTELLLNALAGMGVIRKQNGKYANTEQSAEFLVSEAPLYMGASFLRVDAFHNQFAVPIEDLVRSGPPPVSSDLGNESIWAESARLSAAYQYSGEAQHIARIVSRLPEFPEMTRMLDIGGGAGFYTMAIVSAHPSMNGVVLEQHAVAEVANDCIQEYGMEDRVSTIGGDYTKDDLQGPYDLILASSTLNFFKNQFDELFGRIHSALAPGGIFITHQDGIRDERTQPVDIVSEFLLPEMMGGDFAIAQREIAETMLKSGFQSVQSFTKHSSMGEMEVDYWQKSKTGKLTMNTKLSGIPETLLIPLWARASETRRSDPIIRDEKAVELLSEIDYDFSKFKNARMTQLGVAVRTMLLDRATQEFLNRNPKACIVNLGAGLDTRYARLRHTDTLWYELDLPDALDMRGRFFKENAQYRFLATSAFDESWIEEVQREGRAVLLIAEGLFMYFEEHELKPLFSRIAKNFTGGEMLVEVQGPGIVGKATKHDSLKKMDKPPEFKWGTADSSELTRWHPGISIIEEWSFFDHHLDRAGLIGWLMRIPFLRRQYEPRIVHLRFEASGA